MNTLPSFYDCMCIDFTGSRNNNSFTTSNLLIIYSLMIFITFFILFFDCGKFRQKLSSFKETSSHLLEKLTCLVSEKLNLWTNWFLFQKKSSYFILSKAEAVSIFFDRFKAVLILKKREEKKIATYSE